MIDKYQISSHDTEGKNELKTLSQINKFKDLKKYFNYKKLKKILLVGKVISFEDVLQCFCPKEVNDDDFFEYMCFDTNICSYHNEYSHIDLNKLLYISTLQYEIVMDLVRIEEGNILYNTHAYYFLNDLDSGTQYLIREYGCDIYVDHLILYKCKFYHNNKKFFYKNKNEIDKIRKIIIDDICEPNQLKKIENIDIPMAPINIPDEINVYWHNLLLDEEPFFGGGPMKGRELNLGASKTFKKFYKLYKKTDPLYYPPKIIEGSDYTQPFIYKWDSTGKNGSDAFLKKMFKK